MYKAGIITASDKGSQGLREDASGNYLYSVLINAGFGVVVAKILPDEKQVLSDSMSYWADKNLVDLIITTGGTGLAPRDVTPEATLAIADREVIGISEAIRNYSFSKTPYAMLSRGVSVTRGSTLIINFPGSLKAVSECWECIEPIIKHAIDLLKDEVDECGR